MFEFASGGYMKSSIQMFKWQLVFDQTAAPVPEIMDDSLYVSISVTGT
jgi:hypothetical protein